MKQPSWMMKILSIRQCSVCATDHATSQVLGVGITQPPAKSLGIQGPAAMLVVRCPTCGYCDVLMGYAPKRAEFLKVIDAIATNAWQQHLDSQSQAQLDESCPFDQLALGIPPDPPAPPEASDPDAVPRPSIRLGTPKEPISEDEQRKFLRQLHRTSMRRKTKSFKNWLRRLTG